MFTFGWGGKMAHDVRLVGGPMDGEYWSVDNESDDILLIKPGEDVGVEGYYRKVESVWDGPGVHLWMGWNE